MTRFILRRLLLLPPAILGANFAGFAYAQFALQLQMRRNPFFAPPDPPGSILATYSSYLGRAVHFDFGSLPTGAGAPVSAIVWEAAAASLGLLAVAFALSASIGLWMGILAVRTDPPSVAGWMAPLSTLGLAMPGFYAGTLLIVAALAASVPDGSSLPISGFGWDRHLILPVTALVLRPTLQLAHVTASLLTGELGKRYVITARSIGNTWRTILGKHALRNALAPVVLTLAGSSRLLLGELIAVEWLFGWPGLGRLLATILIPSRSSHAAASAYFLHPETLAATLTCFAALFLSVDLAASVLVRAVDPRMRMTDASVP